MILISELPLTFNSQLQITKHDRPESLKTTKRIILSNYKLILIKDLSPCPRQVFFYAFFRRYFRMKYSGQNLLSFETYSGNPWTVYGTFCEISECVSNEVNMIAHKYLLPFFQAGRFAEKYSNPVRVGRLQSIFPH